MIYWPMLMNEFWDEPVFVQRSIVYAIRTSRLNAPGFLNEVQQAVWSVNPNLPLANVRTLREIYDSSMAQTSFTLVILGIAAGVTLLLGVVGIYGVIAYVVAQRRREVGIRMALGAAAGEVQRLFLRHGMMIAGEGSSSARCRGGLDEAAWLAALRCEPLRSGDLRGEPHPAGRIALVATWLPARQATRVDPSIALRGYKSARGPSSGSVQDSRSGSDRITAPEVPPETPLYFLVSFRVERDPLGDFDVPADAYYGVQTARARENFADQRADRSRQPHPRDDPRQARRR